MNAQRWQFSLVHLLMVVTVAAFFLAFAVKFPKLALGHWDRRRHGSCFVLR